MYLACTQVENPQDSQPGYKLFIFITAALLSHFRWYENGINFLFSHINPRRDLLIPLILFYFIRMCEQHCRDPVHNCWYAPANHGDTFGIRHDEIYFHEDIIPSQPVTSYAVLIRGSPRGAGTSVEGGIGDQDSKNSRDVSSAKQPDVMVDRAVSLIDGLMKTRDFYMSSEFNGDVRKKTPLSMQWYNYIFSCTMQFLPGSIERYKAPAAHSRHIIVMVRGNMYKVDLTCTNEDGQEIGITNNELRVSSQNSAHIYY